MNPRRFDQLLLDLYACPPERSRWPLLLDRICHEMRARSAVIQLLVTGSEHASSRWVARDSASEAARVEHDRHMGDDVNPRLRISRLRRPPEPQKVLRDGDLFAPDDPALAEVKDRLAAIHLGHAISVGTVLPDQTRLALVLHRDLRERRDFDADEESLALNLLPHLRQAVGLAEQIDEAQRRSHSLEDAVNQMRCALVSCDADARVCWANSSAEKLFSRELGVRVRDERLVSPSPLETRTLRRRIAEVARGDPHHTSADCYMVLSQGTAAELQVMMRPISAEQTSSFRGRASEERVLLVLSSPYEVPTLPADVIARVFALSPAESRIAAALCSGLTINEYASASGITIGTARFQLKQVLAKTQVSRQADLVRQICSSVIAQALPSEHQSRTSGGMCRYRSATTA